MSTGSGDKKTAKGWAGGPPPWAVKSGDRPLPVLTPKSRRSAESEGLMVKLEKERQQMQENVLKERARQSKIQSEDGLQAPEDPEEAIGYHDEMTRYHHQAMAHHFAMMYHHHNLCCEAYMKVHGPEYDFRQYRPDIPPMPDLPAEWMEQNMHLLSPYYEYEHGHHPWRPCPPTVPPYTLHKTRHTAHHEELEIPDKDPALTNEEQLWINSQIDNQILEEVTRQIEQEEELPELVCTNGGEPTAEDIDRFIEQVEVLEAWNAPITSVYTKEEAESEESDTDSETIIKPVTRGEEEEGENKEEEEEEDRS
eukprot:TRINITY_DN1642_c1_g1_i1.p1 TRINITY_DN1642_c1_g1~~TRINITY_DN1642_c1_g1_i1.p1  ORF type:complete len:309 (+),score=75.27 TRINITY_DN1642_c1_g1_i1:37-963(+)